MKQAGQRKDSLNWGEHLIWMEGGELPKPASRELTLGLLLTFAIAVGAGYLSHLPVWPFTLPDGSHLFDPVLMSILVGILISNLLPTGWARAGISFSVKKLLPAGVILLGARLHFGEVIRLGALGLMLSAAVVVAGFLLLFLPRKLWKLDTTVAILLATGTAICGGTAIVAVAPILKAKERDVVLGVALVTLLGLIAMLLLPIIGSFFHLSDRAYGIWAGLTIHQTPQVVASGFAWSQEAGEVATIVKLARVCLLAPVALLMASLWQPDSGHTSRYRLKRSPWKLFPTFVLGFLAMALARSFGLLPEITLNWSHLPWAEAGSEISGDSSHFFKIASGFLLAMSMAGVGLQTRLASFRGIGLRPVIAAAVASLVIAVVVLTVLLSFTI